MGDRERSEPLAAELLVFELQRSRQPAASSVRDGISRTPQLVCGESERWCTASGE